MAAVRKVKGRHPYSYRCLALVLAGLSLLGGACAPRKLDASTAQGRQAIVDEVNNLLTAGDCDAAVTLIDKVYLSEYVDNQIRLVRASAYACAAGLNFFDFVGVLQANTAILSTNQLWQLLTKQFPSTSALVDRRVEGAEGAIDAMLASIKESGIIAQNYLFNLYTYNPKSQLYTDRTGDSNIYLTFTTMAGIGAYHNRYGVPDPTTFKKTINLPWSTADAAEMSTTGCGYASALVNFADALAGFGLASSGEIAKSIAQVASVFQSAIYGACDIGCQNTNPLPGWNKSKCTSSTTTCASCPYSLRDRTSCTGVVSDANSCAAAGIVNFMNVSPFGWQGP